MLEFGAESAGRVDAGEFVEGTEYEITKTGTTDFTAIGAADSERGPFLLQLAPEKVAAKRKKFARLPLKLALTQISHHF